MIAVSLDSRQAGRDKGFPRGSTAGSRRGRPLGQGGFRVSAARSAMRCRGDRAVSARPGHPGHTLGSRQIGSPWVSPALRALAGPVRSLGVGEPVSGLDGGTGGEKAIEPEVRQPSRSPTKRTSPPIGIAAAPSRAASGKPKSSSPTPTEKTSTFIPDQPASRRGYGPLRVAFDIVGAKGSTPSMNGGPWAST